MSKIGMSASPPTPDVWLRRSEPTLRANFRLPRCSKYAYNLFASCMARGVSERSACHQWRLKWR